MPAPQDHTEGDVVEGWRILSEADTDKHGRHWHVECVDCGEKRVAKGTALRAGRVICKCHRGKRQSKSLTLMEIDGVVKPLADWARETGIAERTMRWRLAQRRHGQYETDREVVYGSHRQTLDPIKAWAGPGRLDAHVDSVIDHLTQLVMQQISNNVRGCIDRAVRPTLLTLANHVVRSGGKEFPLPSAGTAPQAGPVCSERARKLGFETDAQLAEMEAITPAHPQDNETIDFLHMTVRDYRLHYMKTWNCSIEELEKDTVETLALADKPDPDDDEDEDESILIDPPPIRLDLSKGGLPSDVREFLQRYRAQAPDPHLADILVPQIRKLMEREAEFPTDSLSEAERSYYMDAPWWQSEPGYIRPDGPCMNQMQRVQWMTMGHEPRHQWTRGRTDASNFTFREVNEAIDVGLLMVWINRHRTATVTIREKGEVIRMRVRKHPELRDTLKRMMFEECADIVETEPGATTATTTTNED